MKEFQAEKLNVRIYNNRQELGKDAATMAARRIRELLAEREVVNIIFAAAASQNEFLETLVKENVDWTRVNAFHMDQYIGLEDDAPQQFSRFLRERIFDRVPFREVHCLKGNASDISAECKRYTALLKQYPPDITCMGIGENAHIAFNDPHVADFNDPKLVKVVDLDPLCRQQQVNEGCFEDVTQMPVYALTLTIPTLMSADTIFCMVPATSKSTAVYRTLMGPVTEECPSSILKQHANATLFLDRDSAAKVLPEFESLLWKQQ